VVDLLWLGSLGYCFVHIDLVLVVLVNDLGLDPVGIEIIGIDLVRLGLQRNRAGSLALPTVPPRSAVADSSRHPLLPSSWPTTRLQNRSADPLAGVVSIRKNPWAFLKVRDRSFIAI
jgi:hypothetical protein